MQSCIDEELSSHAEPVIDALRRSGLSVVTAESCTAGLVAAVLSLAPNASDCFHGGFVVYTKAHKHTGLGLDEQMLDSQGTVNVEVARQMAEQALSRSRATLAVSVTGVLGPNPDQDGNAPGIAYCGVAQAGRPTAVVRFEFTEQDPDLVRRSTVLRALELLLQSARDSGT